MGFLSDNCRSCCWFYSLWHWGCPGAGQVYSSYHVSYPVSHIAILTLLFYLTICKVLANTARILKSELSYRAVLGTLKSPLTSNLSSNLTAEAINCGQLQSQADWWYPQRNGHRQKWRKSLPNLPQPSNQRNKKAVSLVPPWYLCLSSADTPGLQPVCFGISPLHFLWCMLPTAPPPLERFTTVLFISRKSSMEWQMPAFPHSLGSYSWQPVPGHKQQEINHSHWQPEPSIKKFRMWRWSLVVYGPDKLEDLGVMSFTKESGGHCKDVECYYSPGLQESWKQLLSFSHTLVWDYDCNQNQCNLQSGKEIPLEIPIHSSGYRDMLSVHTCLSPLVYASACWSNLFKVSLPFPIHSLCSIYTDSFLLSILPVLFSLTTRTKSYQSITLLLDH